VIFPPARRWAAPGWPAPSVTNSHGHGGSAYVKQGANVKNEKQYQALKDKGMPKERAAKIANSPGASSRGGKKSGSGGSSKPGGTTAQTKNGRPQGRQGDRGQVVRGGRR